MFQLSMPDEASHPRPPPAPLGLNRPRFPEDQRRSVRPSKEAEEDLFQEVSLGRPPERKIQIRSRPSRSLFSSLSNNHHNNRTSSKCNNSSRNSNNRESGGVLI